ncbi:hypothetical protein [Corallococcus sp. 4LFB]|uniref:hypothetical protein n=1 Tax=Corallococcus sp. 4LFB TaxID=3383249 RepID=UPI0039760A02
MNHQWVLKSRPHDEVSEACFEWRQAPVPTPGPGEALVRVVWLSIEPTQRTWLNPHATYIPPVEPGEVMRGVGVGQVIESRSERLAVGDWVTGMTGWQEYALAGDAGLFGFNKVPDGIDPRAMLNLYGASGLTAWIGMTDVGRAALVKPSWSPARRAAWAPSRDRWRGSGAAVSSASRAVLGRPTG